MVNNQSIISINNLSVKFAKRCVLSDVSFDCNRFGNIAILGPNGAGKSTFLKALCGLIPVSNGKVSLFGQSPRSFAVRKKLGVCFQKVDFPAFVKVSSICKLIASQYHLKNWEDSEFFHLFGMHELASLEASSLSGGEKKRLMLFLTYFHEPELVVLDEPTAALDSKYQNIFRDYLLKSSTDGKRLTIMSSHMDEDLRSGIDVILRLDQGKLHQKNVEHTTSQHSHVVFDLVGGYSYENYPGLRCKGGKAHIYTDKVEGLFKKLTNDQIPLPNLSVTSAHQVIGEVRP